MVPGRSPQDTRSERRRASTGARPPLVRGVPGVRSCPMRHPWLRCLGTDVLDLVLPRACVGCGAPARTLCPDCLTPLIDRPFCHRPSPCPPGFPPLYAATAYEGRARDVILAWKERGHRGAARDLGSVLAAAIDAGACDRGGSGRLLIVPVPASRSALRRRGEDVLLRVARAAARDLRERGRAASVHAVLALGRIPQDQSGLGAAARRDNLRGAMRARGPGIAPGHIVVVDDVVTTGVTLAEAARALAAEGRAPLFAATIAATLRRH